MTLTITKIAEDLAAGRCSSRELVDDALARIRAHASLNAFITVDEDAARRDAEAADRARHAGGAGALTGVPIAHKDIFCTMGVKTTCGSRMLADFVPPYDATVVRKMKAAGCVMVGKTNMDEFAMGSSNETSYFGPVRNPWDRDRVPGGSSGGSAAAVAARLVPAATGTDTGGSIRQPAALCGITGLKPSYGRVSRYGLIAFASSLDQAGPMAQTAEDCAHLLAAMAGFDEHDATALDVPVPDYVAGLGRDLKGLRIGVVAGHFAQGVEPLVAEAVREALREYERAGAVLVDVTLPNSAHAVPCYYVLAPAEASSNLARYDGVRYGFRAPEYQDLEDMYKKTRSQGFGPEVKRRIMMGTYALSAGYYDAYYVKALRLRRLIADDFARAFEHCDVIAGPVSPSTAFALGAKNTDPVSMYLNDIFTIPVNLAGLPAISLPAGFAGGLPVGLQLIGRYLDEARLLNVAHRFQQVTDWHTRVPAGF
ncbi:Asp-tRNA(Asn)/Glu-tRNA(Gln) amidotransferase subunit GatA [Acidiferrobacter sp.]|uniref:Asp-tRNA(Asn)/Glu-tRNA(Gln) amidotransferase subunit GatA n=1 Tax=Acidiferrobacter sp. TaxID=1872107 RepID=UPI00262599F3|nr:Asp-tRNA(Asn)/Glu-tRNA(Gln) amidotransferase subunit GatA [Acidiferrobacter sp.]